MPVPTVFIGSSTEQIGIAKLVKECLVSATDPRIWDEDELELGHSIFGGLLKAADQFDFAVFVFDADDITRSREKQVRSVRDNVVFELGLFTGRMGRGRTFWISPEGPQAPHIPTDLGGIVHLTFTRPKRPGESQLRGALEKVCQRLRSEIEKLGTRTDRTVEELDPDKLKALCVASSQYAKPKFAKEIKQIHENFPPGSVTSAYGVNAQTLFKYFSGEQKWDILHVSMYVDRKGDLIIPDPKRPNSKDRLPIAGVENLVRSSGARLVTIVTCDSLALGAELGRITNTIAGYKTIDIQSALDWSAAFYPYIALGCPLSEAFNRAKALTDPGLVLALKRDFRISLREGRTRAR
jgi:hypothetical protein